MVPASIHHQKRINSPPKTRNSPPKSRGSPFYREIEWKGIVRAFNILAKLGFDGLPQRIGHVGRSKSLDRGRAITWRFFAVGDVLISGVLRFPAPMDRIYVE